MSRYDLEPKVPDVAVTVGWDPPLNSFFVQVTSTTEFDDGEPRSLLWLGATADSAIWDIELLKRQLRPYADLRYDTELKLRADAD